MLVSAPTKITADATTGNLFLKKVILLVDIFQNCDILFYVMRDNISCEEVFEADPQARAEFDAVCNEWQNEAVIAQDEAMCECDICAA